MRLRPETAEDREFLFALYASTREEELRGLPWAAEQRNAFLRSQFEAQTYHYRTWYPDAAFQLILLEGIPVGRLCLLSDANQIRLIDIALLPAYRGKGVGSEIFTGMLADADKAALPVILHVERSNRAQRLYRRYGFTVIADDGVYLLMLREPRPVGCDGIPTEKAFHKVA